jgi:hypothetical protein
MEIEVRLANPGIHVTTLQFVLSLKFWDRSG